MRTWMQIAVEVNANVCLAVGGVLNTVLIILVLTKTPKEVRTYSKIVLQTCIFDLVNLAIGHIVQPLLFFYNGIVVVTVNGIAGRWKYPWNGYSFVIWFFVASYAIMGVIVQFVYRYLVVCRGSTMGNKGYFGMLFAIGLAMIPNFIWEARLVVPRDENAHVTDVYVASILGHNLTFSNDSEMGAGRMEIPPEMRISATGVQGDPEWVAWHTLLVTITLVVYVFVGIMGKKMVDFVRKNASQAKSKDKDLDKQLVKNLIMQAIIPLVAIAGWVMCSYFCIFAGQNPKLNMLTSLLTFPAMSWDSMLNPLVTIYTIRPYRVGLLQLLGLRSKSKVRVTTLTKRMNETETNVAPHITNVQTTKDAY